MMSHTANFQIEGARHSRVTSAIAHASAKTGVDFDYLVKQARVESSMNPNAKARTSSATGLYQFIDQTWLREMKQHGAEHGYGRYADAIRQNADGDYYVPNRGQRAAILNLRKDPKAASLMAAELATDNHRFLRDKIGIDASGTDLYMAHFLGAQGAANFLTSLKKNPWAPAASFFPEAARANKGVFYAQGRPLSLQQVYNNFEKKFTGTGPAAVVQTASAPFNPDIGDQGPSPVRREQPFSIQWNNPDIAQAQAQAAALQAANAASLRALTAAPEDTQDEKDQTVAAAPQTRYFTRTAGDAYAMRMAASHYTHADQRRYNS